MFRYSMTLRRGNPQALMLPAECLHHYHVDVHADTYVDTDIDTDADRAHAHENASRLGRVGQWLRSLRWQVRRTKTLGSRR